MKWKNKMTAQGIFDEGFNILNASEENDFKNFAEYLDKKRAYYTKFETENLLNMARRGAFREAFRRADKILIDRKYNNTILRT